MSARTASRTGSFRALPRSFYSRDVRVVARALLGRELLHQIGDAPISGRIVEVEAYGGESDPASHARPGPTRRNGSMYGRGGRAYVYRSHGIHLCLNVVTGPAGRASAVLIRALEPRRGLARMASRRRVRDPRRWMPGPGCVGEALGIALSDDGRDLTGGTLRISSRREIGPGERIESTPRIGIRVGLDRPWRFVLVVGKPGRAPRSGGLTRR